MKERPILFSGEMIRAILEGRKTQTRRVVKPCKQFADWDSTPDGAYHVEPSDAAGEFHFLVAGDHGYTDAVKCPYGQPGDRLWVRETWGVISHVLDDSGSIAEWVPDRPAQQVREMAFGSGYYSGHVIYRADGESVWSDDDDSFSEKSCWNPSIHMPRRASRITLEIVSVRVERLNQISEQDAVAEGVGGQIELNDGHGVYYQGPSAKLKFGALWESINGFGSWQQNPWCWMVEFKRVQS